MAKGKKTGAGETLSQLKADLKAGSFRRMYVLFGEEGYLLEYYRRQLRKKLVEGPAEDFNYHKFQEENWNLEELSEAVEAVPMMSEHTLVEIVDLDPFSRPDSERQKLMGILSELPDYCTVVWIFDVVAWKPDKRMKKLWEVMEPALQVEFTRQPESQLIPWIRRHLAAGQKTMSDELCRYLIMQTGGSMTILAAELEKLLCYTDQPEIVKKDIDDVVIPVMEAAIFDITKDVGAKNFDRALQKLRDLLRQDTEPIAVNAVIGRQLRQLYGAKLLAERGKGPYDLVKLYGIWDSAAREIYGQAKGVSKEMLRKGMLLSAQTDYAMKTSGGDSAALLEMMVLELAQACGGTR